ncbi:MAG: divalent metal cation transporter [Pontiellaceae bacterium]|nr:divalent metal cation transporter [Pontiellaceae bacterium]
MISNLRKAIGPGVLVACAAVGGSHLVWSTLAGAEYGWSLVGLILLANLLKFPFFLYGQRYTAATGESLLDGYRRKGMSYVYTFLLINILTGTINIAGVAMLTGSLLGSYGINLPLNSMTAGLILLSGVILLAGHYKILDGLAKVFMPILVITTLATVILASTHTPEQVPDFIPPSPWKWASFSFLIILLGWMPAPVDLSAWSSLWMFSRKKQTGHLATIKETNFDFYLGYGSAVVLAVLFVALGAMVMHGTAQEFSRSGIQFSQQLLNMYTQTIGSWSRPIILTAAFVTMLSTTLTCVDGYPRSLAACVALIADIPHKRFQRIHQIMIVITVIISSVIVLFFVKNLMGLLSFAAVVSFLTSPFLAYFNYRVMTGENVPTEHRPGLVLKVISWAGLLFFLLMSLGYAYVTFFYNP